MGSFQHIPLHPASPVGGELVCSRAMEATGNHPLKFGLLDMENMFYFVICPVSVAGTSCVTKGDMCMGFEYK
eukprot:8980680-Pyramimonas_sp.AAC.1